MTLVERGSEYVTTRSLGSRPTAIGRLVAPEGACLWLLALVPGLLAGTWVARRLGEAVAGLLDLPIELTITSYAITTFGILAIVLTAPVLPFRRVGRLDPAVATRSLTRLPPDARC